MLYCQNCKHLVKSSRTEQEQGGSLFHCKECGSVIPIRDGLHPGDVVAGFEIIREIGRGAMGIVYEARQINLERRVAVKILSEEIACDEVYVERFFREARSAASMAHPNIVQAYDAGVTDDGIYYFVMELIHGENLNQILNREGRVPFAVSAKYFLAIAGALSNAWMRNTLSHGDIKPENIIVQPDGKTKLADFGLARRSKDKEIENEDIRATPAYAPPEILQGTKGVPGFKSDMYSFGATMYHVLTGREPFPGSDPQMVCNMQISAQQISACKIDPDVPEAISQLIDDLMEKAPERRPESWEIVEERLTDMVLHNAEKKRLHVDSGNAAIRRGHASAKTRISLVIALCTVLVLIIIAAIYIMNYANEQEPGQQTIIDANTAGKDAEAFKARWSILKSKYPKGEPPLQELRAFVESAGNAAPEDAVKMLHALEAKENKKDNSVKSADDLKEETNFLQERNALLDEAELFIGGQDQSDYTVEELEDLELSVLRRFALLKTASTTQSELLLTAEQKELINSYLDVINAKIDELENGFEEDGDDTEPVKDDSTSKTVAKETVKTDTEKKDDVATATIGRNDKATTTRTGTTQTPRRRRMITTVNANGRVTYRYVYDDEEEEPESEETEMSAAEQLWLAEMLKLPKLVGTAAGLPESRTEVIEEIQDLIKLTEMPEDHRKLGSSIIRFLQFSKVDLLTYISSSKKILKGQVLFRNTNPGSQFDDLVGKEFRMKYTDKETGATLAQKLKWETIKKDEREERIALNLVRLSVFPKLPEEFNEVLYSKLVMSGMSIDSVAKIYQQTSGLPKETLDRLELVGNLFKKIEVPVEETAPTETESASNDSSDSTTSNKNEPLLKLGFRTREQIEADRAEREAEREERALERQERLERLERAVERTVRSVRTRTNTRTGGGRRN